MELALHLGMTEAALRHAMSERELQRWHLYAQQRLLPWRRVELLLAQVAMVVAQAVGGVKNVTLQDFLFEPPPPPDDGAENDDAISVEDVAAQFGAHVYKKRKA